MVIAVRSCKERALFLAVIVTIFLLFAGGSDLEEGSHYTNTWVVEVHPELSHDEVTLIAHAHGFINHGKVGFFLRHQRILVLQNIL